MKGRNHDKRHLTRCRTKSTERSAVSELKQGRGYRINKDGSISFGKEAIKDCQ